MPPGKNSANKVTGTSEEAPTGGKSIAKTPEEELSAEIQKAEQAGVFKNSSQKRAGSRAQVVKAVIKYLNGNRAVAAPADLLALRAIDAAAVAAGKSGFLKSAAKVGLAYAVVDSIPEARRANHTINLYLESIEAGGLSPTALQKTLDYLGSPSFPIGARRPKLERVQTALNTHYGVRLSGIETGELDSAALENELAILDNEYTFPVWPAFRTTPNQVRLGKPSQNRLDAARTMHAYNRILAGLAEPGKRAHYLQVLEEAFERGQLEEDALETVAAFALYYGIADGTAEFSQVTPEAIERIKSAKAAGYMEPSPDEVEAAYDGYLLERMKDGTYPGIPDGSEFARLIADATRLGAFSAGDVKAAATGLVFRRAGEGYFGANTPEVIEKLAESGLYNEKQLAPLREKYCPQAETAT
ncbi:MAG: hypothetical protein V1820_03215 [archaeon]